MSMLQLVIASALGFLLAQGGVYGIRAVAGWMQRGDEPRSEPTSRFIVSFVKYAAPVGAGVAVLTLGIWAVSDYLSARTAHASLTASTLEAGVAPDPAAAEDTPSTSPPASDAEPRDPAAAAGTDPYADPDYRVPPRKRHAGSGADAILQRSENKARAELLGGLKAHAARSQYDCEALDHAGRYLKAGLDVWGFSQWQAKYFPTDSYHGASLEQCRDIQSVVDPAVLDLRSTVAQGKHP
ncbi:MAG: hypothetical protein JSS29_05620 [Proteobacteria bacterium]|nr:hypothetical protein [Pseudomonadota bacterium]